MGVEMIPLLQMGIFIIFFIILILIGILIYMQRPKAPKQKVEKEEIELFKNESYQMQIKLKPENATTKMVHIDDLKEGSPIQIKEDGVIQLILIMQEYHQDEKNKNQKYGKFTTNLTRESIFNFMEFDEIVDNMIVRKNGTQYIMILQCNGVNYDLMSEDEKIGVEEGFVQFLNTLRFPIQLYIQSRTLNLRDIIDEYKARVDNLTVEIEKLDAKIAQAKSSGNKALKEKLEFEKRRKINILEYGIDITDYVDKLSSNKNVLQQRTYVVVSYYSAEIGGGLEKYSKEEIYNMCFAELYTRCQNIASALANSQVSSTILSSEELAELLYVAYNRDESEILQIKKKI